MTDWPEDLAGRAHLIALEKWLDMADEENRKPGVGLSGEWFSAYVTGRLNLFQLAMQVAAMREGKKNELISKVRPGVVGPSGKVIA